MYFYGSPYRRYRNQLLHQLLNKNHDLNQLPPPLLFYWCEKQSIHSYALSNEQLRETKVQKRGFEPLSFKMCHSAISGPHVASLRLTFIPLSSLQQGGIYYRPWYCLGNNRHRISSRRRSQFAGANRKRSRPAMAVGVFGRVPIKIGNYWRCYHFGGGGSDDCRQQETSNHDRALANQLAQLDPATFI